MLHSLSRYLSVAADENRFLPFFPFPFLCFHNEDLHDFCRNVFLKTPFFQFGFPLALARKKYVSLMVQWVVKWVSSPCCEPVLLLNNAHGAWKRLILYHVEPANAFFDRVPFLVVSIQPRSLRGLLRQWLQRCRLLFCFALLNCFSHGDL